MGLAELQVQVQFSPVLVKKKASAGPWSLDDRPPEPQDKAGCSLAEMAWSALLVTPLVVAQWRGCWELMVFYTPEQKRERVLWWSVVAGAAFGVVSALLRGALTKSATQQRRTWRQRFWLALGSRLYLAAFAASSVAMWRGLWELIDMHCGHTYQLALFSIGLGSACLARLRCMRNLSGPPFVLTPDLNHTIFAFPTRYRTSVRPDAERVDLAVHRVRVAPRVQLRAGAAAAPRGHVAQQRGVAAGVAPLHGLLQLRVRQLLARRVADARALHRQRPQRAHDHHDGRHSGARRHAHPAQHRRAALRHRHRRQAGLLPVSNHVQGQARIEGPCATHTGLRVLRIRGGFAGSDRVERHVGHPRQHPGAGARGHLCLALTGNWVWCDGDRLSAAGAGEDCVRQTVRRAAPPRGRPVPVSLLLRHRQPVERRMEPAQHLLPARKAVGELLGDPLGVSGRADDSVLRQLSARAGRLHRRRRRGWPVRRLPGQLPQIPLQRKAAAAGGSRAGAGPRGLREAQGRGGGAGAVGGGSGGGGGRREPPAPPPRARAAADAHDARHDTLR